MPPHAEQADAASGPEEVEATRTRLVVFERTANGWSAYPPALPVVGVAGATREETEQLAAEAIAPHLHGLADDGLPIPESDAIDIGHVEAVLPA